MNTVFKYPFAIADRVTIALPRWAMILHVDCQDGVPCLWALVNTDQPDHDHDFRIYGTGHGIDKEMAINGKHVATFQQGSLVWHMFQERSLRSIHDAL